MKAGEFVVQQR